MALLERRGFLASDTGMPEAGFEPEEPTMAELYGGSIILGMGFVVTQGEAQALIHKNAKNRDVLFPYLNGEDLNSRPDQSPSRWVINFHDWPLERTRQYLDAFRIVEEKVKPERGLATPPHVGFEPTFATVVLASLPAELRRNASLVEKLFVIWRDPRQFAHAAAPLACTAALTDAVRQNPEQKYATSEEMDRRHCVYAPTARVFTADKRNVRPLEQVLSRAGIPTRVIRTRRLHLVLDAIRNELSRRQGHDNVVSA